MLLGDEYGRMPRTWCAVAIGAMVAGSLAGCSDNRPPIDESQLADISLLGASVQRTLLISTRAENVYVQQCMNDAGFEFFVVDDASQVEAPHESLELFVGEITEESAPTGGYGPYVDSPLFNSGVTAASDDGGAESTQSRSVAYFDSLSEADQAAWGIAFDGGPDGERIVLTDGTSIPAQGCLGEAMDKVHGDALVDYVLLSNKIQRLLLGVNLDNDPGYSAAMTSWRGCMAKEGYAFDSVAQAIAAGVALRGNAVQPTDAEISQAVTDAACQTDANLLEVTLGAVDREARTLVDENLALILAWRELEATLLKRCGEILGFTYEPLLTGSE